MRYELPPEVALAIETRNEDRRKAGPPILHECTRRLLFDRYDRAWAVAEDDYDDWQLGEIAFCPYCGTNLRTLVPKE